MVNGGLWLVCRDVVQAWRAAPADRGPFTATGATTGTVYKLGWDDDAGCWTWRWTDASLGYRGVGASTGA